MKVKMIKIKPINKEIPKRNSTLLERYNNRFSKSCYMEAELTIVTNFISSKDVDKESVMHLRCDSTEFMTDGYVNNSVDEPFQSSFSRYQIGLETLRRGSDLFTIESNYCITNAKR